jgi:hypothetical protein
MITDNIKNHRQISALNIWKQTIKKKKYKIKTNRKTKNKLKKLDFKDTISNLRLNINIYQKDKAQHKTKVSKPKNEFTYARKKTPIITNISYIDIIIL